MSHESKFEHLRGGLLVWPLGAESQKQAGSVSLQGTEPSCLSKRSLRLQLFSSPTQSSADFTAAFRTRWPGVCVWRRGFNKGLEYL